MTKRKKSSKPRAEKLVTLEDVARVAHTLGMEVSVKLVPNAPVRPLLAVPTSQWPGDPTCRSVMADMEVTLKKIEREFKDNPTSKWVITPYEIIERNQFFAMLQAKLDEVLCVKCGLPAAFPKAVSKPYTCSTCRTPVTVTGTTTTITPLKIQ